MLTVVADVPGHLRVLLPGRSRVTEMRIGMGAQNPRQRFMPCQADNEACARDPALETEAGVAARGATCGLRTASHAPSNGAPLTCRCLPHDKGVKSVRLTEPGNSIR